MENNEVVLVDDTFASEEAVEKHSILDGMSTGEKIGAGSVLLLAGYGAFKLGQKGVHKAKDLVAKGKAKIAAMKQVEANANAIDVTPEVKEPEEA